MTFPTPLSCLILPLPTYFDAIFVPENRPKSISYALSLKNIEPWFCAPLSSETPILLFHRSSNPSRNVNKIDCPNFILKVVVFVCFACRFLLFPIAVWTSDPPPPYNFAHSFFWKNVVCVSIWQCAAIFLARITITTLSLSLSHYLFLALGLPFPVHLYTQLI